MTNSLVDLLVEAQDFMAKHIPDTDHKNGKSVLESPELKDNIAYFSIAMICIIAAVLLYKVVNGG